MGGKSSSRKSWSSRVPKAMEKKAPKGQYQHPDKGLKLVPAMKALIVKEVQPKRETKSVISYYPPIPLLPNISGQNADPAATTASSIWRIVPSVAQGVGEAQRLGLSCEPVSLRIHGFIYLSPRAGNTTPNTDNMSGINVRFYALSSKKIKNYASLSATGADPTFPANTGYTNMAKRLLTGNGNTSTYTGALSQHESWPTNHKEVTVHHMRNYHIRRPSVFANVSGYQNPVKIPFSFNIPVPKHLDYNSDSQVTPASYAPMVCAGWCYDNNAVAPSDPALAPTMVLTAELRFKDA